MAILVEQVSILTLTVIVTVTIAVFVIGEVCGIVLVLTILRLIGHKAKVETEPETEPSVRTPPPEPYRPIRASRDVKSD